MKKTKYIGIGLLMLLLTAGNTHKSFAQLSNYKAYSIFVYNFAKYTNWPAEASADDFVITVVGKSDILEELNTLAQTKTLNGRKITVRQTSETAGIDKSHLVFVAANKSGSLDEIVKKTKGKPTLIVTERDGLVKKGAHISFIALDNEPLKFEVNTQAMENHHLQMAKSLLALSYKE